MSDFGRGGAGGADAASAAAHGAGLTVLIPIYDDWAAVREVLYGLDAELAGIEGPVRVLIVDDGSSTRPTGDWLARPFETIESVDSLTLRYNVGHQRAIAVGLCHLSEEGRGGAVVVMDGDGEDRPADVPRLWRKFHEAGGRTIVFAERIRRSEGILFTTGYHCYRWLHRLLTGIPVRVGNFSILPCERLSDFVFVPDLWNHYAAAVFRARLPRTTIPAERGVRRAEGSRMQWVSLVTHGLSALAVFGETVGVRLMLGALALSLLLFAGLLVLGAFSIAGAAPPLRNALLVSGFLLILLFQIITVAAALALFILSSRSSLNSFPIRNFRFVAGELRRLYPRGS